jgi:hypothetical protein
VRRATLQAATTYFACVFAAGFVLGTIRTLIIAPQMGDLAATVLELPAMLALSWFTCAWVLRQTPVPRTSRDRLGMGMAALLLLLFAEAVISLAFGGLTLAQHVALYARAPILLGLAGQLAFALFPWVQGRAAHT